MWDNWWAQGGHCAKWRHQQFKYFHMEMCQYFSPNAFRDVFNLSLSGEPFFTSTITEQNSSNRLSVCSFLNVFPNLDSTNYRPSQLYSNRLQNTNYWITRQRLLRRPSLLLEASWRNSWVPPGLPWFTAFRSAFASVEVNRCAFFAGFVFNINTFLKLKRQRASVITPFYYSSPHKWMQHAIKS